MLGLPFVESIRCKLFEGLPVALASCSNPTVTLTRSRSRSLAVSGSPFKKSVRASSKSALAKAGSRFTRSTTVLLEFLDKAISFTFSVSFSQTRLSRSIFRPKRFRALDVSLLTQLRAASQQDHDIVAVFPKVDPVAGSPVDPILPDGTNPLDGRRIPEFQARSRRRYLCRRLRRKTVEPSQVWYRAVLADVFEDGQWHGYL